MLGVTQTDGLGGLCWGSANTGVSGEGGTGEDGAEGYVGIGRARKQSACDEGLELSNGEESETGRRGEWMA